MNSGRRLRSIKGMELQSTIGRLYQVFQPYRLGPDFSGCDHCVDPRETEHLTKTPLRDLSLEDLRRYAFKAMTTWGEVTHFKHFLPRLFELAADGPLDFELEILFGKLEYAKWEEWAPVERECVNDYLRALWLLTIRQPPPDEYDERVSTVLCAIGNASSYICPFLDAWTTEPGNAPPQQLAQFILINYEDLATRNRLASAYWQDHEQNAVEVIAWLKRPAVGDYLRAHEVKLAEWQQTAPALLAEIAAS